MSIGGQNIQLRHGDYTADITSIGAGMRTLAHSGGDLVVPYGAEEVRPLYRGALLAPWPNRVVDGRYSFAGADHQLPINEVERHHALHGLVSWQRFDVVEAGPDTVALTHRTVPAPGYPFELELAVVYRLDDDGLHCSVQSTNVGTSEAPYGVGPHPYLRAGTGRVDDWTLQLPATQVLQVTPDRLVPRGLVPVTDTDLDFRSPRLIAGTTADHALTGLVPDADGVVRVALSGERGLVRCEWDPTLLPWVQVHTADLPDPAGTRIGLALEPMSCPPDAFNSGTDLVVLEPGRSHSAWWRLRSA